MINAADHLGLVHLIANRYRWACGVALEYEDLVQLGSLGLMRAIEKFDPERGVAFSTYAGPWIRQAISRGIKNQRRLVRLPVYLFERGEVWPERTAAIADEVSEDAPRGTVLLGVDPRGADGARLDIEKAYEAMRDDRTRFVVRMRQDGHGLEPLAKRLGVSRERVRQIEIEGLARARHRLGEPRRAFA